MAAVTKVMFDDGSSSNNNDANSDALTATATTLNPNLSVAAATVIVEAVCALLATLLRPQGLKVRGGALQLVDHTLLTPPICTSLTSQRFAIANTHRNLSMSYVL